MTIDSDQIHSIRSAFRDALSRVAAEADLRALRDQYLGRKGGVLVTIMKSVAGAPADERPLLGRLANALKQEIESALEIRRAELERSRPVAGAVDVTLSGRPRALGHRHPLAIVREQIEEIFTRMGYQVLEGPELEDDWHNFEALNMPPEHPARDMQDTLYLTTPVPQQEPPGGTATLLRTHTSGMQIRYMETHQPPVRIIAPGRVYRRDNIDLSHTPMFTQVEALVVDEGVSLADLKGTVEAFCHGLYGPDVPVLFRPSFFPYTEPSAEAFIGCIFCKGAGCSMCKRTGWLEIGGSGVVHPAVFEAVGYDPERYSGFAFGFGIERMAILKYGVEDIRLFYENDLRFLEQFPV